MFDKLKGGFGAVKTIIQTKIEEIKENPEDAIILAGEIIGIATGCVELYSALKPTAGEKLDYKKDRTYYDPHTGIRWSLTRPMSNREKSILAQRQRRGEATEYILYSLGVIR